MVYQTSFVKIQSGAGGGDDRDRDGYCRFGSRRVREVRGVRGFEHRPEETIRITTKEGGVEGEDASINLP